MNSPLPFLRIQNLTKIYNKDTPQQIVALDNLNLDIQKGDFISVIGSNGSGKTSLLNLIAGTIKSTSGTITLDGDDISNVPAYLRANRISRVYQDPKTGTSPSMTVEENVVLASLRGKGATLSFGITSSRRSLIIDQLKKLGMGLENRLKDEVSNLSGGERQALAMVMATLVQPQLLLLDEHCVALDPRMTRLIMDMTDKLAMTYKLTTLMVSHDMELALNYGHRLIMLHKGKVIRDISKEEKKKLEEHDLIEIFRELRHQEEILENNGLDSGAKEC